MEKKFFVKRFVIGLHNVFLRIICHIPLVFLRMFFLKYILRLKIGKKSVISGCCNVKAPWNISIGNGTIIGRHSTIDGRRNIEIGNNVNISSEVMIWTLQHDFTDESFTAVGNKVIIGDYVWLCTRSVILPGITIGEGAVVALGAVVTKDVEPYTVVGGIPARKISERPRNLKYSPGDWIIPFE